MRVGDPTPRDREENSFSGNMKELRLGVVVILLSPEGVFGSPRWRPRDTVAKTSPLDRGSGVAAAAVHCGRGKQRRLLLGTRDFSSPRTDADNFKNKAKTKSHPGEQFKTGHDPRTKTCAKTRARDNFRIPKRRKDRAGQIEWGRGRGISSSSTIEAITPFQLRLRRSRAG